MAPLDVPYVGFRCHFRNSNGCCVVLHLQHHQQVRLHIENKQIHSAREVLLPILLTLFIFTESLNTIIGFGGGFYKHGDSVCDLVSATSPSNSHKTLHRRSS